MGLVMLELDSCLNVRRSGIGMTGCIVCGDECESVVHVLWECPAHKEEFVVKLRAILGEAFKDFEAFNSIEKASFVLGGEL